MLKELFPLGVNKLVPGKFFCGEVEYFLSSEMGDGFSIDAVEDRCVVKGGDTAHYAGECFVTYFPRRCLRQLPRRAGYFLRATTDLNSDRGCRHWATADTRLCVIIHPGNMRTDMTDVARRDALSWARRNPE